MRWITAKGNTRPLSEKKYSIKWDSESLSLFQFNVKQFFKKYWIEDIVGEEVLIPQTRLRVDIVNFSKKIAVEVNGLFHVEYTPYFQNSVEDFERQVYRDVLKEYLLEKNGFEVIEIYEKNMPLKEKWVEKVFGSHILR
jgi:very-short-patch-repair endonuclease